MQLHRVNAIQHPSIVLANNRFGGDIGVSFVVRHAESNPRLTTYALGPPHAVFYTCEPRQML